MTIEMSDADLRSTVAMFEGAIDAVPSGLVPVACQHILLVLDESDQEATTAAVGGLMAARQDARLHVLMPRDRGPADETRAAAVARRLIDEAIDARAVAAGGHRVFDQVLRAAEEVAADLIVMPAPLLDDYRRLGDSALGTAAEMILPRCRQPVLLMREPRDPAAMLLDRIILPLPFLDGNPRVASWAVSLADEGATMDVLAVADAEEAAGAVGPHRPETAGLIASLHRLSQEKDYSCHLHLLDGSSVQAVAGFANDRSGMLVIGDGTASSAPEAALRVRSLVLSSLNPVLVI